MFDTLHVTFFLGKKLAQYLWYDLDFRGTDHIQF